MLKMLLLKDQQAEALHKKEKLLYFAFLFFLFSLYTPVISWLYNAGMWVLVAGCLVFNSWQEKKAILKERKFLYLVALFFLLSCLSAAVSINKSEGLAVIGYRLTLLAIPLSLGLVYISQPLKERIVAVFAIATTAGALLCLLWSTYQAVQHHDLSLLYNDNLSLLINFQSVYLAMLVNMSVFSYMYLLVTKSTLLKKWWLIPALLILFVANFLLASRISIGILYGSVVLFAVYKIVTQRKLVAGLGLVVGLLLAGFLLLKFFPKTINRFKELTYTRFDFKSEGKESHFNVEVNADQWNGANIRLAVWQCTWAVIKQHPVVGTSTGDKLDELKKQYLKQGFMFGYKSNRSVHNNYLDIWLSMGLIGLLIFVTGYLLIPIVNCFKNKDWFGLILLTCLVIAMVTETHTDRMLGNTVIAFVVAFVTSYKRPVDRQPIHYPGNTAQ